MRFFEKLSQIASFIMQERKSFLIASSALVIGLSGCGSDSGSSDTGFYKFYNASSNSPAVYITIEDNDYSNVEFGKNSTLYELNTDTYELELSWKEDSNDFNTFHEEDIKIQNEQVALMMVAGDFENPEVLTYEYEDENPEEEDDVFAMRFINMQAGFAGVDVYYAKDDETFEQAVLFDSLSYQEMSESQLITVDETYKFYITMPGESDILYESEDIPFLYTTQYIMIVRENTGPSNSAFSIDKITKTSQVVEYPDKESSAELQFYNGIAAHEQLPTYAGAIDLDIMDVAGNQEFIGNVAQSSFTDLITGDRGDLIFDIYPAGGAEPIDENQFLSMQANDDKTVFLYTTVQEEVDVYDENNNGDYEELIEEVYIDKLTINNSTSISIYDHSVNIINLVDDYSILGVAFKKDNETVAEASYFVNSQRATPQTVTLPNNTYQVQILYTESTSTKTLASKEIILTEDSTDMFLIIEGEEDNDEDYTITFIEQNRE